MTPEYKFTWVMEDNECAEDQYKALVDGIVTITLVHPSAPYVKIKNALGHDYVRLGTSEGWEAFDGEITSRGCTSRIEAIKELHRMQGERRDGNRKREKMRKHFRSRVSMRTTRMLRRIK